MGGKHLLTKNVCCIGAGQVAFNEDDVNYSVLRIEVDGRVSSRQILIDFGIELVKPDQTFE